MVPTTIGAPAGDVAGALVPVAAVDDDDVPADGADVFFELEPQALRPTTAASTDSTPMMFFRRTTISWFSEVRFAARRAVPAWLC
jgi:hypothetical protein